MTDHLDTPRFVYDDNKTLTWRWASEGFGDTTTDNDPDGDGYQNNLSMRFPGQYHDQESGLYYNWHRYYDPETGRYVTSDPIGLDGGLNTFGYVFQNPMAFFDSTGLKCVPLGKEWTRIEDYNDVGPWKVKWEKRINVPGFNPNGGSVAENCLNPPIPLPGGSTTGPCSLPLDNKWMLLFRLWSQNIFAVSIREWNYVYKCTDSCGNEFFSRTAGDDNERKEIDENTQLEIDYYRIR